MAITTISQLKTNLNIGARPNLFEVGITLPTTLTNSTTIQGPVNLLCKGAAIPAYTLGVIEVPFRGERLKVPGDRTFADWTATFVVDSAHLIRDIFKQWTETIAPQFNADTTARGRVTDNYYEDIDIKHYDTQGNVVRYYKLYDAFPVDVSTIDLSSDSTDTLSEFTVTFQYHYLRSSTTAITS